MRVVIHGDTAKLVPYCEAHGMTIVEQYTGDLESYNGDCLVLVTDNCKDKNEYYYLKYKLLKRKIELVSTHWCDCAISDFVEFMNRRDRETRREKHGGRLKFGYRRVDGEIVEDPVAMAVVRRIFELRDQGCSYRVIQEDSRVRYLDGCKLPLSTIQVILRNREKYEKS